MRETSPGQRAAASRPGPTRQAPACRALVLVLGILAGPPSTGAEQPPDVRPFRITVVDRETGRGVPLVELRTVHQVRYVTDSNGVVAFDEPGLLGRRVFFSVKSHGYEFPKDGFGYRGVALETRPGGEARITVDRINVARRLYRVTGGGIYRDSLLTGTPVPVAEPVLDGQVLGQDSVLTAVYQGKIHWFWGDTNRPGYPLGNFHTPGATSELPGKGGLDPARGVNLRYFLGKEGFARPTCEMPGPGPTWITGLVVLRDKSGRERMFADYAKIKPPMETYQRGLVEWDPTSQSFRKVAEFPLDLKAYPGEHPGGHTVLHEDGGTRYIYYCSPYPLVRAPADPEALADPETWESLTCLRPGTRVADSKLDRAPDGTLRYAWKKRSQVVGQQDQAKLIKAGAMKPDEGLLNLRDVETGKTVLAHGGTVTWNAHRRRWVMIAVEVFGTSLLGEVWYAEADTLTGPWVYARKIVTHEDYSFYNPRQHPMFDQENGRIIHFEGTYTTSFSGSKDPTPRYDYNQVMYQLDLDDRRLALPVPVYRDEAPGRPAGLATGAGQEVSREIAFFAPDRPGIASLAVIARRDGHGTQELVVGTGKPGAEGAGPPIFFTVPADRRPPPPDTAPLLEFETDAGTPPGRYYGAEERPRPGYHRTPRVLGRVWTNPSRQKLW